jgi:regulatory protein
MEDDETKPPKKKGKPKEPTSRWLRDQALRYLDRFATTTQKMHDHLYRKSQAGAEVYDIEEAELRARINKEIDKLVSSGFLNDREYAASKARVMAKQGKSLNQIRRKMIELNLSEEIQAAAVSGLGDDTDIMDKRSAARYVRKRKFGPYKSDGSRKERLQKELGSLARNGFSYDIAIQVLNLETEDLVEELINGSGDL